MTSSPTDEVPQTPYWPDMFTFANLTQGREHLNLVELLVDHMMEYVARQQTLRSKKLPKKAHRYMETCMSTDYGQEIKALLERKFGENWIDIHKTARERDNLAIDTAIFRESYLSGSISSASAERKQKELHSPFHMLNLRDGVPEHSLLNPYGLNTIHTGSTGSQ